MTRHMFILKKVNRVFNLICFSGQFFLCEIIVFFIVAMCDLGHEVETVEVSQTSLIFQKRFPDAVSSEHMLCRV